MEDVFIGFRATHWPSLVQFLKALDDLGVEKSELAKRAIEHGLQTAIRELEKEVAEKQKRDKELKNLLKARSFVMGRSSGVLVPA